MKPLSGKTATFTESVIREMTRLCVAAGGLNLAQGFPDFEATAELKQAAIDAITRGLNQYPITHGEPALRQAIAAKALRYNGMPVDPDTEITVTCGATEGMVATLTALINPGDEVVVFEPFYENYGPDSILSGATPRYVTLHAPDWHIDPGELRAAFTPQTKAIIINTPNNPTGKVFTRDELSLIAELCQQWDAYAVTDEIYEHILYDGAQHLSLATLPGMAQRTITVNSISKTYSVTGWRVGWTIAAPAITRQIRKVHDFLTVGAPTPLQHAAAAALAFPDSYYDKLSAFYQDARDRTFGMLQAIGLDCSNPAGAYYILADASRLMRSFGVADDVALSCELLRRVGVAAVPGSSFYAGDQGRTLIRFTFCKKPETLDAVERALRPLAGTLGPE